MGVVAFLWRQNPFTEYQMANVSGNSFTYTITGQTNGATISYAVKFAYAGGLSVTRYFSYIVGEDCSLTVESSYELDLVSFLNPATDYMYLKPNASIDKVEIHNMLGKLILVSSKPNESIDIKNLSKGMYLVTVYQETRKSVKKMIVK